MKKALFAVAALMVLVSAKPADAFYRRGQTAQALMDKFSDFDFVVLNTSRTLTGDQSLTGNVTFYGYATQFYMKSSTSSQGIVNFGMSFSTQVPGSGDGNIGGNLSAGDTLQDWFPVAVDSPTIITFPQPFPAGCTIQIYIGGYKRDTVTGQE